MKCKVEISARHIHLSGEDFGLLFGKSEPTKIRALSHNQDYCDEVVSISGDKNKLDNIRLVAPLRDQSQVEISMSDAIFLGINAPLKLSGDTPGAKVKIAGPAGSFEKDIAIVAKRHLHCDPKSAEELGISENDIISAKIIGERGLTFDNVIVRIADSYELALNLDNDEGNAAGISKIGECELIIG